MREILFRGKDVLNNEWVYGFLTVSGGENPATVIDYRLKHFNEYGEVDVFAETVGQFTGLTDKNGSRIFEGDIIRITSNDYCGFDEVGKVVFLNGCFGVSYLPAWEKEYSFEKLHFHMFGQVDKWNDYPASGEMHYKYEIIGNTIDNPKLWEV